MWHRTKARQSSMTCIYAVGCLSQMEHVWERGLFDKLLDWGDTPSYFGVLGVFGMYEAHHPRDIMFKSEGSMPD